MRNRKSRKNETSLVLLGCMIGVFIGIFLGEIFFGQKTNIPKIIAIDEETQTIAIDYDDFSRILYEDGTCCDFGNGHTKYEKNTIGE